MSSGRHPKSLIWLTLFALTAVAILIWLGTWQLQRRAWKEGLIQAVKERSTMPPQPLPKPSEWDGLDPSAIEYRHVVLAGIFEHDKEVLVFTSLPETKGAFQGIGAWVMTPLRLDDGARVIVNRGFVPSDRTDPATRAAGQKGGQVVVSGLMRWSEQRNAFTPADDPEKGVWYTRDPKAIAAAKGLSKVAPFFVDADTTLPGELPQGGETRLAFPNRHLEYALTWYGLAATLTLIFTLFVFRRPRKL